VEQRLATTLGRTARTVSSRVMTEVGAHPRVFDAYITFAKSHANDLLAPSVVEVLGLWRNPAAADFLAHIANDRKHAARHEAMLALGNMGGPAAEKTLTQALAHAVSGRTIDGDQRRDAIITISALGRLVRAMPAEQRGAVISAALKAIPTRDTELVIRAILNFFVGNFSTYNPAQLKWAAQVATMALWTVDRPELAKAARNAPLGFRQPLIELLERLAPHAMDTINETVMTSAKTYSAAYLAVGELYTKVPDPSQLPVLRQLLLNTFLYDDESPRSAYTRETVLDTATDEKTELRKDQVLASLIYAVGKIGGDEASAILADLFEQIRAGRLPQPGRDAADILFTAYTKSGAGQAMMKGTIPTAGNLSDSGAQAAVPHLDQAEMLQLIRDLEGSYLMAAKRRTKKVSAMAALAHAKAVAALPAIINHLADKDTIIAAAAQTALADFASPPVPKSIMSHYLDELLRTLEIGDDQTKVKLVDVFMRLGPRKSPLKERLETLAHNVNLSMATKSVLARLLEPPPEAAPPPGESHGSDLMAESAPTARNLQIGRLDRMRAYNLARQEWIRKGKHGPEPKPPD
jgi:HEAT repeat protein